MRGAPATWGSRATVSHLLTLRVLAAVLQQSGQSGLLHAGGRRGGGSGGIGADCSCGQAVAPLEPDALLADQQREEWERVEETNFEITSENRSRASTAQRY